MSWLGDRNRVRPLVFLIDSCVYLVRTLYGAMIKLQAGVRSSPKAQIRNVVRSTRHDMASDPDEIYYAAQYWHWIAPVLSGLPSDMTCLDLGCGQGRLAIRIAEHFPEGRLVGVDVSAAAVSVARQRAAIRQLGGRIEFLTNDIEAFVAEARTESVDLILLTEVTFFWPAWRDWLGRICDLLVPGGLICIAFRSQYFDALCLARQGLWNKLPEVINKREGRIFDGKMMFTWQTSKEVKYLLEKDLGLELVLLAGVGCASGLGGDPHDLVARPSLLDEEARQRLMELELYLGPELPDAGRYMLAVARKPEAGTSSRMHLSPSEVGMEEP
jgi:SAM-dependent methyltransferase